MPTFKIDKSGIRLWSGAEGSIALAVNGDLKKVVEPGANPIASATFEVEGDKDFQFSEDRAVGIGIKAGAKARIVPMFQENQGAGADIITRFSLGDALTPENLLLALELGADADIAAQGAFKHGALSPTAAVQAGVDATYVAVRSFERQTTLDAMLKDLFKELKLPGAITSPPNPGDLVSFEFGGQLKYSLGASAGYELKGSHSIKVSEIALSEHYALSVVGKLTLSGEIAGRFSVDVTSGSQPGFARVVVRRRRRKELQVAADVNVVAGLVTDGLQSSGKEFLGALLGVQAKSWLNLADTLVTKAGTVDSIETLKTKLDGLSKDYLSRFIGKAVDKLAGSDVTAFQSRLAKVVDSYRTLDTHAIALFDRYFDPVLNRVEELTAKLDELNAMPSWDRLKGEIDPTLWNIVRQLTDGDPLGWALGIIPGTTTASLPELKKRINDALSLVQGNAHQEIRDFIRLAKEQFGLDPFINQLATISSPDALKALAQDKVGHFAERLIGNAIDRLNGNELKKAFEAVKQVVARRDAFFATFDKILKEAAAQKFTLALHAAYNSAEERDALMDMEIRLVNEDGSPNLVGQRYMAAAGRGDFQEVLANFQPSVVLLRDGLLSHKVSSSTTLKFNVAGWHRQFNYESMHLVVVNTEQQIRDSGNGFLTVFTSIDMKADSQRRRRGSKGEETILSNFLLRLLGETKVSDSSFDKASEQYLIDVITGMSARYSVTFTDEDTSSEELDDYLLFARQIGLDTAGATRAALEPFLEVKNGSFGKTASTYEVRYMPAAVETLLTSQPDKEDIKRILRRIVLANYFSHPTLQSVGWLYASDDVRTLADSRGPNFVDSESVLGNATVRLSSPIPGLLPPKNFSNVRMVRNDVAVLFRIEDDIVRAFQDLTKLLQSTKPIKTKDLEDRLKSFGKALDGFDAFDEGENSIFAVFDGLIQLQTSASRARASSLTFVSSKDGAEHTKVFTLRETSSTETDGLRGLTSRRALPRGGTRTRASSGRSRSAKASGRRRRR